MRLARLFVDDRDAAEDIVQEAFLRLARHAGKIDAIERAPAYLRSIVLNLARDHNRRGLVSLRHHSTAGHDVDVNVASRRPARPLRGESASTGGGASAARPPARLHHAAATSKSSRLMESPRRSGSRSTP